jgi:hypothetical protein
MSAVPSLSEESGHDADIAEKPSLTRATSIATGLSGQHARHLPQGSLGKTMLFVGTYQ